VIGVGAAGDLLAPGQHGTTFGGNPVCCAAGLAVLRTIAADRLADHAAAIGKEIARGVEDLHHPLVSGVRGVGLLLGITLRRPVAATVASAAQRAGYLINPVQPDVLRLAPPLVIDHQQAHDFVAALPAALDVAGEEN
jgi:acetylornithine aminotransferase